MIISRRLSLSTIIIAVAMALLLAGLALTMTTTATGASSAQAPSTLMRPQDPVVIDGASMPASWNGIAPTALRLFAYDEVAQTFSPIPYQFDDITSTGVYTIPADDDDGANVVDGTDEFVFMGNDGGDSISASCDIVNLPCVTVADAPLDYYEIEVTDPLDGGKSWAYAVDNAACPTSSADYAGWNPLTQEAIGAYDGQSFRGTFGGLNPTPFLGLDNLEVNGNGTDILDRLKVRVDACVGVGSCGLFSINFDTDEEGLPGLLGSATVDIPIDGPIRLVNGGPTETLSVAAYGSRLDIQVNFDPATIPAGGLVYVDALRASFDLNNPATHGFNSYMDSNGTAYTIDGSPDPLPALFDWYQVTDSGTNGGLYIGIPTVNPGAGTQAPYYWDDIVNPPPDGLPETGDGVSYGDTGVAVLDSGNSSLSFELGAYILPPGTTTSVGARYFQWSTNDLVGAVTTTNLDPMTCGSVTAVDMAETSVESPVLDTNIGAILMMAGTMLLFTGMAVNRKREAITIQETMEPNR